MAEKILKPPTPESTISILAVSGGVESGGDGVVGDLTMQ